MTEVATWAAWRAGRLQECLTGGLSPDLSERLVDAELSARQRAARLVGFEAAYNAELIVCSNGNLALSFDGREVSPKSGAFDLARFYYSTAPF